MRAEMETTNGAASLVDASPPTRAHGPRPPVVVEYRAEGNELLGLRLDDS